MGTTEVYGADMRLSDPSRLKNKDLSLRRACPDMKTGEGVHRREAQRPKTKSLLLSDKTKADERDHFLGKQARTASCTANCSISWWCWQLLSEPRTIYLRYVFIPSTTAVRHPFFPINLQLLSERGAGLYTYVMFSSLSVLLRIPFFLNMKLLSERGARP